MEHNLLSKEHQAVLKAAADKNSSEEVDKAISFVKMFAPRKFLTENEMDKRVFYHRPAGMYWSGTFVSTKLAYK